MTVNKKRANEEIITMPLNQEEEKIFHWVESDKCLGSWMPGENDSVSEKTKYQFSQEITRYLVKNNLTEEEMAQKLGLNKNTTARLLRGYVENFSLDSLINYTKKLNGHIEVKIDSKLEQSTKQIQNHLHWCDTIIQALTKINYEK